MSEREQIQYFWAVEKRWKENNHNGRERDRDFVFHSQGTLFYLLSLCLLLSGNSADVVDVRCVFVWVCYHKPLIIDYRLGEHNNKDHSCSV